MAKLPQGASNCFSEVLRLSGGSFDVTVRVRMDGGAQNSFSFPSFQW